MGPQRAVLALGSVGLAACSHGVWKSPPLLALQVPKGAICEPHGPEVSCGCLVYVVRLRLNVLSPESSRVVRVLQVVPSGPQDLAGVRGGLAVTCVLPPSGFLHVLSPAPQQLLIPDS